MTNTPSPPAHVDAYVRVLGVDLAITFLLTFGGAELYMAANPKGRSRVAELVGLEKAVALSEAAANAGARWQRRVPTAKPWIANVWLTQGLPKAEIARRLHVSDVTVRKWLDRADAKAPPDERQPRFL